jgi:hypothetical protein
MGTSIAALLQNKGMNLNKLGFDESETEAIVYDFPYILPPMVIITVKEPKFFNENTMRWMCPDATTGRLVCPSNKQNKTCKPNCEGCVLRKET